MFWFRKKNPIFDLPEWRAEWMCVAAEFIQVAEINGNKCWRTRDSAGFHFCGGTLSSEMLRLAQRLNVYWWPPDWEERVKK